MNALVKGGKYKVLPAGENKEENEKNEIAVVVTDGNEGGNADVVKKEGEEKGPEEENKQEEKQQVIKSAFMMKMPGHDLHEDHLKQHAIGFSLKKRLPPKVSTLHPIFFMYIFPFKHFFQMKNKAC
jgi:hypothetical protein